MLSNFPFVSGANVTVYPESHELLIAGKSVHCTPALFRLLTVLLKNYCATVSYNSLLDVGDRPLLAREQNLLKVQISYLRRLLKNSRAQLEIKNVYDTGYQARPRR
ncbi:MAG: hypothetical protein DLM53_11690 [Candidatus Eremiobacter antarcticus]|nr:helix-turn-helix domain-containing protein [Candidatus Eremiobacteraeota bacterium]MBC5809001.1 helix-turn-helix domain-containing protein [Candidatus Eremiobacteraeota bacterium]PZR60324.1 MAG: hypothetical protein DLM53_11690 [Candidatus Eremiobacter sp. RRmetagenome_bin22]